MIEEFGLPIMITVYGIIIATVICYFMYCIKLDEICKDLNEKGGILCYIPGLNKLKLLRIGDLYGDAQFHSPFQKINFQIPRVVVALLLGLLAVIGFIFPVIAIVVNIVVFAIGFVVWYDIGFDIKDESPFDLVVSSILCAIPFIHCFSLWRLCKYHKMLKQGALYSCVDYYDTLADENYNDETIFDDESATFEDVSEESSVLTTYELMNEEINAIYK